MRTKWLAENIVAFEPEGAADNLACVTSDELRRSGWSETVIQYVERYRFGSADLQRYEEQMAVEAEPVPDAGALASLVRDSL